MKNIYRIILVFTMNVIPFIVSGQVGIKTDSEFQVFLRRNAYNKKIVDQIHINRSLSIYDYLGNYYIDRNNRNTINYEFVKQGLRGLYPKESDSGFLNIDIENSIYKHVRDYPKGHPLFERAVSQLRDLILYTKDFRPNVKVGLYGIPFYYYWPSQEKRNENRKLDVLLKEVDYISPAIYIHYSDLEFGQEANIRYIQNNLKVALDYGSRLRKPVIPYVWYKIHSSNKKFGSELIDRKTMLLYFDTIKSFQYLNTRVSGVLWWEPSKNVYKNKFVPDMLLNKSKDDFFDFYIPFLLNED